MNYLCARHRHQVLHSPALAHALWQGAFQQGQQAFLQQDWVRARNFFGSAFDIAKVRLADAELGLISPFNETRLVASADYLVRSLQQLRIFPEAEAVTRFARQHLAKQQAQQHLTQERRRHLARLDADIEVLLAGLFAYSPAAGGIH